MWALQIHTSKCNATNLDQISFKYKKQILEPDTREMQRRQSVVIAAIAICSSFNQKCHDADVTAVGGEMKGGVAILTRL